MTISFPSTKAIKDEIREAIGQDVTITVIVSGIECSICSLDPVHNVSIDPFCSGCGGDYWISAENDIDTIAHVRWAGMDTPEFNSVGFTYTGDVTITVDIDALTTDQVNTVKYITVDERKVQPYKTIYRGVAERDRVRFVCKEMEKV